MALTPDEYIPRLIDPILERRLKTFGAVEVTGAKYCGKTWTSLAHAESAVFMDDPSMRAVAELDQGIILEGAAPRLIDEWQDMPSLWGAVRHKVDEQGGSKGAFILTGSSSVDKTEVAHSGAGRIASLAMSPLSLYEAGLSSGRVSLKGLFEGSFVPHLAKTGARELASAICRGGWPGALGLPEEIAADVPQQYLQALFEISAPKRGLDPGRTRKVAQSLARNVGKALTYKTLYRDVFPEDDSSAMDSSAYRKHIEPYLRFLVDQYCIELQNGWDAPVKARSRIRSKPKRSFADPSLPAALLSMTPDRLVREPQVFGTLFEELCLRDIRVYSSALGLIPDPTVSYYGDANGLEVDAVVELPDGRWGAFEVKLNESKAAEGEASLLRLRKKVTANAAARNPEPSFMAVLVGVSTGAYTFPSGVHVVPVASLGA